MNKIGVECFIRPSLYKTQNWFCADKVWETRSDKYHRILENQIQDPLSGFSETPDKRQHFNEDRASKSVNRVVSNITFVSSAVSSSDS